MNVVINALAVQKLGFKSPQDAVGKVIRSELFESGTGMVDINIIGVVGDTRFRSVRSRSIRSCSRTRPAAPGG